MRPMQRIFIAIGCFAGVTVVFSLLVIWPIFQGVLQDHKAILEQERKLLQIAEDRELSREFEQVSVKHATEFMRLENLFVDTDTPVPFFRFLDGTAQSFGLQMEKTPGNTGEAPGDTWPSFEMRLVGHGPYPGFMAFLQRIENAPYLMEVKNLTVTSAQEAEAQPNGEIEFSLLVKAFTK